MNVRLGVASLCLLSACGAPATETRERPAGSAAGGAGGAVTSAAGGASNPGVSGAGTGGPAPGGGAGAAGSQAAGGGAPSSGGASGTGGSASSGGSAGGSQVVASAGCGKPDPATGALSVELNGSQAAYTVTLPQSYDENMPLPLIFGFHGRGRTHVEFQTVDAGGIEEELGSQAVMAYLKSQGGNGWEQAAERELNVDFFELVLARMLAGYCVDTSRIFAVGHSSGAHFTHILACRFGDMLRGIGAVAGYHPENTCSGDVAAMIIHGATDTQVANSSGEAARDYYLAQNGCSSSTVVGSVSPCVAHQDCDHGLPVEWCEHTEPTYENTNHGWPSFASEATAKFFFALP